MAVAGKWQAAHFNRPGFELFDYDVYAIAGDGDLMEGVSHEAASFAGHQRLDNLCWIYDNNHISIDGRTEITYDDDVAGRFMAYGWNVTRVGDANDFNSITRAFDAFKATDDRPTLIIVDSHIGYGSPHKQDTAAAHGEPLGEDEVRETKRAYGWPEDAQFLVPDGVREHFAEGIGARGRELSSEWEQRLDAYERELESLERRDRRDAAPRAARGLGSRHPDVRARREGDRHPQGLEPGPERDRGADPVAGLGLGRPHRLDLGAARRRAAASDFEPANRAGRQLHYGIREHESAAISNGLSLSKVRPSWSTYLVFSDYARPAIRLSALMELPVIHIFTHDSIGLGEDGPTHQPVEHLASLRAIPGLNVIRPCDANEVAEAWRVAIERRPPAGRPGADPPGRPGPRPLALRRAEGLRRGGYVLADADGRRPRADPDRDRQRGRAGDRGARAAGRRRGRARGSSACRRSSSSSSQDRGVPREVLPPSVGRPRLDRGGLDARLGPLRRAGRGEDRHAHLRLLGAAQGRARTSSASRPSGSSRRRASRARADELGG